MSGDHLNKMQTQSINTCNATNSMQQTAPFSVHLNHKYVKLNIGGRLFSTSIDTLTKQDNMLRAMFSGRMDSITDSDGYILIDRCGKHFDLILNYLRDEDLNDLNIHLDSKTELELNEIQKEAKFYCMQPLTTLIEQKINKKSANLQEPYLGASVVSMITAKNDLAKILSSTDKPCIRLLINRHNNKYSYTNTSDDNLLKNIELFERMAIKFKNRIMFIKDTTSNEEICCWYFHGNGKKLTEVCCTSIVYTTEKKQTKVEFPDSKILEEIFVNAVLFESNVAKSNEGHFFENDENESEMPRINIATNSQQQTNITSPNSNNTQSNSNALTVSVSSLSLSSGNQTPNGTNLSHNSTSFQNLNNNSRRSAR